MAATKQADKTAQPTTTQNQPVVAHSAPISTNDTAPVQFVVETAPADQAAPTTATRTREPRAGGLPGGPLLLTAGNAAALGVSNLYYAAGIPGVALLATAAAGTAAVSGVRAYRNRPRTAGAYNYGGGGLRGRAARRNQQGSTAFLGLGSGGGQTGSRSPFLGRAGRAAADARTSRANGTIPAQNGQSYGWTPGGTRSGGSAGRTSTANGLTGTGRNGSTTTGRTGSTTGRVGGGTTATALDRARRSAAATKAGTFRDQHLAPLGRSARTGARWAARTGGRMARASWSGSAPARHEARRRLRLARRWSLTLLLASLAGILGKVLRPFTKGSGKSWFMKTVYWRAARSRAKEDALAAKDSATGEPRTPVSDTVDDPGTTAPTQARPGAPTAPPTSPAADPFGGSRVSVFASTASQVAEAYSRYSPPSMMAVAAEYRGVPDGIRHAADAIRALAGNSASAYPVNAAVTDMIAALYTVVMQAAAEADNVYPTFRKAHDHDIQRHEAPRNGYSGEQLWNIGGRPGGGGGDTTASVFETAAQGVAGAYARYTPDTMMTVGLEYAGLPEGLESLAQAVQSLAVNSADNYPVDPRIAEMVGAVVRMLMQAASNARDIAPTFRRLHALDISHHESPRNGTRAESMWNV